MHWQEPTASWTWSRVQSGQTGPRETHPGSLRREGTLNSFNFYFLRVEKSVQPIAQLHVLVKEVGMEEP